MIGGLTRDYDLHDLLQHDQVRRHPLLPQVLMGS